MLYIFCTQCSTRTKHIFFGLVYLFSVVFFNEQENEISVSNKNERLKYDYAVDDDKRKPNQSNGKRDTYIYTKYNVLRK